MCISEFEDVVMFEDVLQNVLLLKMMFQVLKTYCKNGKQKSRYHTLHGRVGYIGLK